MGVVPRALSRLALPAIPSPKLVEPDEKLDSATVLRYWYLDPRRPASTLTVQLTAHAPVTRLDHHCYWRTRGGRRQARAFCVSLFHPLVVSTASGQSLFLGRRLSLYYYAEQVLILGIYTAVDVSIAQQRTQVLASVPALQARASNKPNRTAPHRNHHRHPRRHPLEVSTAPSADHRHHPPNTSPQLLATRIVDDDDDDDDDNDDNPPFASLALRLLLHCDCDCTCACACAPLALPPGLLPTYSSPPGERFSNRLTGPTTTSLGISPSCTLPPANNRRTHCPRSTPTAQLLGTPQAPPWAHWPPPRPKETSPPKILASEPSPPYRTAPEPPARYRSAVIRETSGHDAIALCAGLPRVRSCVPR
ncbi:hypothetical protein CC78DRAFT_583956 [Lojkania enalia]|uniref:Uncharacterized protein n=1 Tax=Lojkania enalia TaxID=147567 RepID=A0A9P4K496_9PLEO|nr:hypothetical protein CC78DRAFT_583956 [Didymosphaeria enalia]